MDDYGRSAWVEIETELITLTRRFLMALIYKECQCHLCGEDLEQIEVHKYG